MRGSLRVSRDIWRVSRDILRVSRDIWRVSRDIWRVIRDTFKLIMPMGYKETPNLTFLCPDGREEIYMDWIPTKAAAFNDRLVGRATYFVTG